MRPQKGNKIKKAKSNQKQAMIKRNDRQISKEPNNYQDDFALKEQNKGLGKKFPVRLERPNSNDPQWYFKDANVLSDVASYSFSTPLGTNMNAKHIWGSSTSNWNTSIPGLMTLAIGPAPGVSTDAQSPVNLAATNVYSFVRYKNSGAKNYDAPDLMMYLLAMDSVYSCWNWMKRLYGIASTYSQTNRYYPRALVEANGVDFDDLLANLADFRAYLNLKSYEISAFCVPATMTYNVRHSWIFSNVYKDGESDKAQSYMFVPAYFYKYDETTSTSGGQLVPQPVMWKAQLQAGYLPSGLMTVTRLETYLNDLLEALNYSEDIGIMSGDILKAYEQGGLFKVSTFEADYRVDPVYNEEVLSQFENAHVCGAYVASGAWKMKDNDGLDDFIIYNDVNTNYIQFQPSYDSVSTTGDATSRVVNFHHEHPTPSDMMVATRLTTSTGPKSDADNTRTLKSCGSEICFYYTIYSFILNPDSTKPTSNNGVLLLAGFDISGGVYLNIATPGASMYGPEGGMGVISMLTNFDWHPQIDLALWTTAGGKGDPYFLGFGTMLDFDKYTVIDLNDIDAMNLLALLTEFNVPN